MSIRLAEGESDQNFVRNLIRLAREAGELWAHSWPPHQVEGEIQDAELWILESDSGPDSSARRPAGFCFLRPPGSSWEITLVAIEPSARRRGGFFHLISELRQGVVSDRERSALSSILTLEVRQDNLTARRAYENAGFVVRGHRKSYFHDGQDAVLYELK